MKRIKCTIAYDGGGFSGFQIQPYQRTVQGELEQALQKIHKGSNVRLHASGRTDAGVHAVCQVFHFDTELEIPTDGWRQALEALTPSDIQVKKAESAPLSFHARFSAVEKEYRYFVLNQKERDIFRQYYLYHSTKTFDMNSIQQACEVFEGTHDFTAFASARSTVKGSKVRTLTEVSCHKEDQMIQFMFRGSGFLQHMVRNLVGALLKVGEGKCSLEDLALLLNRHERTHANVTAPPEGLYLWSVRYD